MSGAWTTAVTCMATWLTGEATGLALTSVATAPMVLPTLGSRILRERKSA